MIGVEGGGISARRAPVNPASLSPGTEFSIESHIQLLGMGGGEGEGGILNK